MSNIKDNSNFSSLSPDIFIDAVEDVLGTKMSGIALPLNSYINRVYELQAFDGSKYVAKFYRPGRWSHEALKNEHEFVLDCKKAEIPVIEPLELKSGGTLSKVDDVYFAVFPKKFGRVFEILDEDDWIRVGSVLGRLHNVGAFRNAEARIKHHPEYSMRDEIDYLCQNNFVPARFSDEFRTLCDEIMKELNSMFDDVEFIRTHGDCHCNNILHRPGEGIMLIDFDDMMMAPPVQDLWLVLPDYIFNSRKELDLILDGYEQFREFDYFSLKLIEPLRLMRMLYFLSWLAKQSKDQKFIQNFPNWGTDSYWRVEINDLQKQLQVIRENKSASRY